MQNYVVLMPGVPARLHFYDHDLVARTITDPLTRKQKSVTTLVFQVDELDGKPAVGQYSTLSQKHYADFQPYLDGKKYTAYDFTIRMVGNGHTREYQLTAALRAPR